MKKIFVVLFFLTTGIAKTFSQTQSDWSPWKTIVQVGCGPEIEYRINWKSDGINNPKIVELKHNGALDGGGNAAIEITLKGIDDDGKYREMSFNTGGNYIQAWQPYSYSGNWHLFKKVDGVVKTKLTLKESNGDVIEYRNDLTGLNGCKKYINGKLEEEVVQERLRKKEELEKIEKLKLQQQEKAKKDAEQKLIEDKKKEEEKKKKEEEEKKKTASKNDTDKSKEKKSTETTPYVESEEARQMRERAEAQNKANQAEDKATVAGLAGVVGIGALLTNNTHNDFEDEDYPFVLRGLLGANYQNIPVTTNYFGSGFTNSSVSSSTDPICIGVGLEAKFLSNKFIGFSLNPFLNYGFLAFSSETGSMLNYGGNANLKFGRDFQIVLKGGYEVRDGSANYDAAEIGVNGYTNSKYNYNTLKYGVGLKYKWIELAALKEDISFLKNISANVFSYELTMAYNIFGFSFKYAPNYPIAGEVKYPNAYEVKKQNLLQLGMYWRFSIVKSK